MKKCIYKWLSAMLVAALILIGFGGEAKVVFASEERVWNYEYEGYSVEYVSYSDWGTGCNSAIILTNQTSESIKNWELSFDYDREITDISNAVVVSHEQGHYVIKNAEYNVDIAGYESIHIVFIAGEGEENEIPEKFSLQQTTVDESSDGIVDEIIEMPESESFFSDEENVVTETMIVDEMTFVSWLINSTDEELLESGYTEEEVYEIRNYNYSDDILALQALTRDELGKMGYDENQIEGIYGYEEEEDALQYATTFGLSSARLTVTYHVIPLDSQRSVQIHYAARWNMCPMFCINDYIAIAWIGCDVNSHALVTKVIAESHQIAYHSAMFDTFHRIGKVEFKEKKANYRVLKIDMDPGEEVKLAGNGEAYDWYYAKQISGVIAVKTAANSYNLNNIIVRVGYSHTVIRGIAEPSIDVGESIGLSFSFSFDWKAQELYNEEENFKYDGTIILF